MSNTFKYTVKVGDRFLAWVDDRWYETQKEPIALFELPEDARRAIKMLKKHYAFDTHIVYYKNGNWTHYNKGLQFFLTRKHF